MQGKPLGFPIQKRGLTDTRNCSNLPYSSLAQSVEHLTVNQVVTGSSPVGGAISGVLNRTPPQKALFFKAFLCFLGNFNGLIYIAPFCEPI